MRCLFLVLALLITGCSDRVVYVSGLWPVLPEVKRPTVIIPSVYSTYDADGEVDAEAIKNKMHPADVVMTLKALYELTTYAERLETVVRNYNAAAENHNKRTERTVLLFNSEGDTDAR